MFKIRIFALFTLFFQGVLLAEESHYSIAVGEEDKERLLILNEIYTPFTKQFVAKYVSPGDEVLEIGCGIGLVSQELSAIVGHHGYVLATDLNKEQLTVAQSLCNQEIHPHLEFRKLSAYELDSLKQKFDVVYMRFLLCHLPNPEEVIRQVKNVLKPGGRFIIEDLTGNHTLYSDPSSKGMEALYYTDKLQFEIQQSDDQYFSKLPSLLERHGFSVKAALKSHPELETTRKRKFLTYNLLSLKDALVNAGKITLSEYNAMYSEVEELVENSSTRIFSYELGQISATH